MLYLWADRMGWPAGKWPKDRRYDAVLITRWCQRGWPMEFWTQVIEQVPAGAHFTYLTTPPEKGKVARLEEGYIRWREGHYATVKKDDHWSKIGDIIRQHFGPGNPEGGF